METNELIKLIETTLQLLNSEINDKKITLKIRVDGINYDFFPAEEKPLSYFDLNKNLNYFKTQSVGAIDLYSEMKTKTVVLD